MLNSTMFNSIPNKCWTHIHNLTVMTTKQLFNNLIQQTENNNNNSNINQKELVFTQFLSIGKLFKKVYFLKSLRERNRRHSAKVGFSVKTKH